MYSSEVYNHEDDFAPSETLTMSSDNFEWQNCGMLLESNCYRPGVLLNVCNAQDAPLHTHTQSMYTLTLHTHTHSTHTHSTHTRHAHTHSHSNTHTTHIITLTHSSHSYTLHILSHTQRDSWPICESWQD
jgi:hypothetical protein